MTPMQRLQLFQQVLPAVTAEAVQQRAQQLYGFACLGSQSSPLLHLFVCGPTGSKNGENFDSLQGAQLPDILAAASESATRYEDKILVPDFLLQEEDITALVAQHNPTWVPLPADITAQPAVETSEMGTRAVSKELNMTVRRLDNGVRVIYKCTPYEKNQLSIEMHLLGGRACEGVVPGVKTGALSIGLQTAMESGLAEFSYDAIVRYCQLHDLDYDMRTGFEGSTLEITASTTQPTTGLRRAFELAHLMMTRLGLEEVALERNKRVLRTNFEADLKSLESRTSRAMLDLLLCPASKATPDTRFLGVTPDCADKLTLEDLRAAIDVELTPDNLEVVIAGDFPEGELDEYILRYLGTLSAQGRERVWADEEAYAKLFQLDTCKRAIRARVEIPDDVVRSYVCMGFSSVNRWGVWHHVRDLWDDFPGGERQLDKRMRDHGDMFVSRCIALLSDIVNNRLYERVRERGGLVYSVDLSFDPLFYADVGFFVISLAPFPDKMDVAVQLVQTILADVQANGITEKELEASRRPTISEVRQNLERNSYWMSLMQGTNSQKYSI
jgi:predicted Zn-dependent peptidase